MNELFQNYLFLSVSYLAINLLPESVKILLPSHRRIVQQLQRLFIHFLHTKISSNHIYLKYLIKRKEEEE